MTAVNSWSTGDAVRPTRPKLTPSLTVQFFDYAYSPRGQLRDYQSSSVDWLYLDAGTGNLLLPDDSKFAALILDSPERPVPVVVTVNGVRWPGRVADFDLQRTGRPGTGTLSVDLVSEWIWLRSMLGSQNGSDPSVAAMPAQDTMTGPVCSVAAYFINAAAARLGVPVVAMVPIADDSATVTVSARLPGNLADLLTPTLAANGISLDVDVWTPDVDQPPGGHLGRPTIVFTPRQVANNLDLRWSDSASTIGKVRITGSSATGYRGPVGLDGTDESRVYDYVTDDPPGGTGGSYALPEAYVDAPGTALGSDSQAKGLEEMRAHRGTRSASFEVNDGHPHSFGRDYLCGDLGTLWIQGSRISDRITKVTATRTPQDGVRIGPVLGDLKVDDTPQDILARAIKSVARQVALLQRR